MLYLPYDLRVSDLGSFRIIEHRIFTFARIRNHIASIRLASRHPPRRATATLLVSVVFLALASTASCLTVADGARNTPPGRPRGQNPAVSRLKPGAVSRDSAASSRPVSAWLRARGPSAGELGNSISTLLISPNYAFPLLKAQDESNASAQFAARRSDRCAEQPPDRLADLGGELRRKPRPSSHAPDRSPPRADLCRLPGGLVLGDAVSPAASAKRGFLTKPLHRGVDKRPLIG